ncbi:MULTISPECIES: tyrosinase family protein [unclassified Okeania]|uniref:tyrosinase family protein n=1 Tax=unclassified Okeania TaxID=2634635 RepID=UPI0013BC7D40|nr:MULTISPECIES: tyrosinase family protein [unclassified Okeania]NES78729.1 tyrosinase family protein [Okeania sp. SIO1H4]NET12820.1 tyrosinase family protein [Okeania sp. SIO1H6]NET23209.1 tyrosinase family protein [Okeania sp. SIO1H5]NET96972.1 tyrosinase family protein [Okeania sp. SIO1H2]
MKELIETNSSAPQSWIMQAFIHGDCNGFNDCQHANWYFAPWHRSYLYYFEKLIQHFSENPNFALPYWDWSSTISVPSQFYGDGNPLDDNISIQSNCPDAPPAGRGVPEGARFNYAQLNAYVGAGRVEEIQSNPDYKSYLGSGSKEPGAGELEETPHNFVHRWVGGEDSGKSSNMVQTFSPLDPIFWMHHCNVDRLYSDWLGRDGHNYPNDSEWTEKSFNNFYDADGNQVGGNFTCGDTVNSTVMGYIYDTDKLSNLSRLLPLRTLPSKPQVIDSVVASKSSIKENLLTFETDTPLRRRPRSLLGATAVGAPNYVVRLRIEGVKIPKRQDTGVFIFLGSGITPETPISAPGFVDNFTFFEGGSGSDSKSQDHKHKKNVILNATKAVKRLYGNADLPEDTTLPVSIVTRSLFGDRDASATVEEIQPDRIKIEIVDLNG